MKLTAFQRRCLESYVYLHGKSPTLLDVLSFRSRGWLPFLMMAVLSSLMFYISSLWGMFMIGMTMGAVLRIIGYARFTVLGWPVIERVLDWDRVASVLRADALPPAEPDVADPTTRAN